MFRRHTCPITLGALRTSFSSEQQAGAAMHLWRRRAPSHSLHYMHAWADWAWQTVDKSVRCCGRRRGSVGVRRPLSESYLRIYDSEGLDQSRHRGMLEVCVSFSRHSSTAQVCFACLCHQSDARSAVGTDRSERPWQGTRLWNISSVPISSYVCEGVLGAPMCLQQAWTKTIAIPFIVCISSSQNDTS